MISFFNLTSFDPSRFTHLNSRLDFTLTAKNLNKKKIEVQIGKITTKKTIIRVTCKGFKGFQSKNSTSKMLTHEMMLDANSEGLSTTSLQITVIRMKMKKTSHANFDMTAMVTREAGLLRKLKYLIIVPFPSLINRGQMMLAYESCKVGS